MQSTNLAKSIIPQYTSEKVIEIFKSQYTEQLNDRKANSIVFFCRENKTGFFYQELLNLIDIINFAVLDLKKGVKEMNNSLIAICECASYPFKKNKASNEIKFVPKLPEFLNCFK